MQYGWMQGKKGIISKKDREKTMTMKSMYIIILIIIKDHDTEYELATTHKVHLLVLYLEWSSIHHKPNKHGTNIKKILIYFKK